MSLQQENCELRARIDRLERQLEAYRRQTDDTTATVSGKTPASFPPLEVGLEDSEELFRAYVETANDMVYAVNLERKLTFINPYGRRLLGCSGDEWQGRSYLDFIAPKFREATARAFDNLVQTGELKDFEFAIVDRDGREIEMEVNGRLLYRHGRLVGGLGIARDITERKQFERQLQMFRKAVESAYDSAAIVDLKGNIIYANPAAERMFGRPDDSLAGKNATTFFPEDAQTSLEWPMGQAIEGGWSGEVICQRPDGERFPALVSAGPVPGESGSIAAVSLICRDITSQKAIQAELAAKNIELERASRLKSEFLANMSHELRTPLTSILGFSSLLQQQIFGPLNPKQLVYVQRLHHSGEHLLNLIKDVLDLSKVEAGKVKLDIAPVPIVQLCEETLSLVSEQLRNRRLTMQTSIPKNIGMLMADELRVRQMLLNLLSNAIKFSPQGGEIGMEARTQAGFVQITVWDRGIGIPEEKQKLLFQPFQQLDSSLERRHQGTGLGLALTRQFAELHGGTVSCQSKEGEGSRFTISLPLNLYRSSASSEEEEELEAIASPVPAIAPSGQLLLVEDHQYNAMLLKDILEHWGYEVQCVTDGYRALQWLGEHHPDLILMDIHLPGINGMDLARRIKTNPQWKGIPIVAMTAMAMVGDRERCLQAGMEDYLSKPVDCDRLAAVLTRYAGQPTNPAMSLDSDSTSARN